MVSTKREEWLQLKGRGGVWLASQNNTPTVLVFYGEHKDRETNFNKILKCVVPSRTQQKQEQRNKQYTEVMKDTLDSAHSVLNGNNTSYKSTASITGNQVH